MSKTRTPRVTTRTKAAASAAGKKPDGRRKPYDDAELAMELARGASPTVDIARRMGLSVCTVRAIRAGRCRPEFGQLIRQAREQLDRRLLARVRRALLARVRRLLRKGLSSRRATASREALLDLVLGNANWRYHREKS